MAKIKANIIVTFLNRMGIYEIMDIKMKESDSQNMPLSMHELY